MSTEIEVNQPTAAPTKKIQAVGIVSLVAPLVGAALVSVLDLSDLCGQEAGAAVTILVWGLLQGASTTFAGYMKRNTKVYP